MGCYSVGSPQAGGEGGPACGVRFGRRSVGGLGSGRTGSRAGVFAGAREHESESVKPIQNALQQVRRRSRPLGRPPCVRPRRCFTRCWRSVERTCVDDGRQRLRRRLRQQGCRWHPDGVRCVAPIGVLDRPRDGFGVGSRCADGETVAHLPSGQHAHPQPRVTWSSGGAQYPPDHDQRRQQQYERNAERAVRQLRAIRNVQRSSLRCRGRCHAWRA